MKRLYITVAFIALAVMAGASLLLEMDDTLQMVLLTVCGIAVLLLWAVAVRLSRTEQLTDPDPDGTEFVRMLTEMMDTISRATAERSCGIDTQLLYESARFCEPCKDPAARTLEREILKAIAAMKPDDSDEEISKKCRAVMAKLSERSGYLSIKQE